MRLRLALPLLVVLLPTVAAADVVGPPPDDCPLGSQGEVCHGVEYCRVLSCSSDADCGDGEICQSRDLCIAQRQCGGRRPPDAAPPPSFPDVTGVCSEMCAEGSCETRNVCVPDGTPPGTESGGCGCRAAGDGSPAALLVPLAAILALALRRR